MMYTLNRVSLIGNITAAPCYMTTINAADLTSFQLATIAQNNIVEYHQCVAWGPSALLLHEHLTIGSTLAIQGSLHYHQFTNGRGNRCIRTEIRIQQFTFLDS